VGDRVAAIGRQKSKGLIGLHHFTGADWGGKFVGVSKKSGYQHTFHCVRPDEIVLTFAGMGQKEQTSTFQSQDEGDMPEKYRPIERFVCHVYSKRTNIDFIPDLRWKLSRKKTWRARSSHQREEPSSHTLLDLTTWQ